MPEATVVKDEADQMQFDASKVEGLDPAYRYRWARNDPVNMMRQQMNGYEIVSRTTEKHAMSDATRMKKGDDLDTSIRFGDMILVRTPKENDEKRRARTRSRILRQTTGVTSAYKDAIARLGGGGERNLVIEEHRQTAGSETTSVTEKQFDKAMSETPEDESRRIGRR